MDNHQVSLPLSCTRVLHCRALPWPAWRCGLPASFSQHHRRDCLLLSAWVEAAGREHRALFVAAAGSARARPQDCRARHATAPRLPPPCLLFLPDPTTWRLAVESCSAVLWDLLVESALSTTRADTRLCASILQVETTVRGLKQKSDAFQRASYDHRDKVP
eukprot:3457757-Rhodomonas_salina.3